MNVAAWFNRVRFAWAAPLLIGAVLRVAVIVFTPHTLIWDEASFHALASRLAQGGAYGVPFWPPAWPYTLAALYRLVGAADFHAGLWFNVGLSLATLLVFGKLAARLFSPAVAIIAMWLMALLPSYSLANDLLIYEVTMQFLLILILYLAVRGAWSWPVVAALALLCAVLTLFRPTWFGLPGVLWLLAWCLRQKNALWRLLVVQLAVVALIAPWVIYASQVSGRFVPIAAQGGLHLWMANNPAATGTHVDPPGEYWDPQNEPVARQAALDYLRQHPERLVTLLPAKLWYMFRAEAWTDWFFASTAPPAGPRTVALVTVLSDLSYYAVLALAVLAAGSLAWRRQWRDLSIGFVFGYGVVAQIALFTGQLKYRWPLQFCLLLLAAAAVQWGWQRFGWRPAGEAH